MGNEQKNTWKVSKAEYSLYTLLHRITGHWLLKEEFFEILQSIEYIRREKLIGKRQDLIDLVNNRKAEFVYPVDLSNADIQIIQHKIDGMKMLLRFDSEPTDNRSVATDADSSNVAG